MKKKPQNKLRSQAGQITVEYILLAVALFSLFHIAATTLKDSDKLKNFQETPRNIFKNLVENGNFEPKEKKSQKKHPNHRESHRMNKGYG